MTQFGACLKKDMTESFRTKRFWFMLGVALGMVVLSALVVIVLNIVCDFLEEKAPLELIYILNNSCPVIDFYMAFMSTYFVFIAIFMFCNIIPKEIRNKKWINPVSAGLNPRYMFLSKLLMTLITTVATAFVACVAHFVFTLIYANPADFEIGNLIAQYCYLLIYIVFVMTATVCLGTISRHGLISGAAVIGCILLFTTILQYIPISAGGTFIDYTPFLFWKECSTYTVQSLAQYLWAAGSTIAICVGLVVWALLSTKIKGAKKLA